MSAGDPGQLLTIEEVARLAGCITCGVEAGYPCRINAWSFPYPRNHQARVRAALQKVRELRLGPKHDSGTALDDMAGTL